MKNFKKKMTRLKIGAGLAGVFFIFACVFVLFDFGSGLAINSYTQGEDRRRPAVVSSAEDMLLAELENGTIDDEYLNNMYFTKDNFKMILEAISKTKASRAERETEITYEGYREIWHEKLLDVPVKDAEGHLIGWTKEWGWGWDYDNPTRTDIHRATDIEENPKINPFGLYWQPIYALCQMQSSDIYDDKFTGWEDEAAADGSLIVKQRLDEDTIQKAINAFNMSFYYVYDASADSVADKVMTTDRDMIAQGIATAAPGEIDANGDPVYYYNAPGRKSYKWYGGRNGGMGYENICYTVESEDTFGNTIDDETFWQIQPDEGVYYERTIWKVPTTMLASSFNGYSSHKWYTEENTITMDKYHYEYDDYCKRSDTKTKWDKNLQVKKQLDYIDIDRFYRACKMACSSFDWEEFLYVIETLPDSENIHAFYSEMYEKWKAAYVEGEDSIAVYEKESYVGDEDFQVGSDVIIGCNVKVEKFSKTDNYVMPGFGTFKEDEAINATLKGSDNLSVDDIYRFFTTYPAMLANPDSCITNGGPEMTRAIAESVYRIQEEYDVSAMALLAIVGVESGWGTNRISKEKGNFVSWGAYDFSPYASSTDFGLNYADAIYYNFEKICKHYIYRSTYHSGQQDQDTYYSIRWGYTVGNTGHNYATDTEWPSSMASVRVQIEKFFGIDRFSYTGDSHTIIHDGELLNPLSGTGYTITSRFGPRTSHTTTNGNQSSSNHKGIDLAGCEGAPILAMADGYIEAASYSNSAGYNVVIGHGSLIDDDMTYTKYMHMERFGVGIVEGQYVHKGNIIGYVGHTGNVYSSSGGNGAHLHFEVLVGGTTSTMYAIDPQSVIEF